MTYLEAQYEGEAVTCAGLRAESRTAPVCKLCRELVAAGHPADMPMLVRRAGEVVLVVAAIGRAALLTVEEEGGGDGTPRFAKWKPWQGTSEDLRVKDEAETERLWIRD